MATVNYVIANGEDAGFSRAAYIIWTPLTATNVDGQPFFSPFYSDKTVQVLGTFGGATVTMYGVALPASSNPSAGSGHTDYDILHKVDLSNLTFTARGMFVVLENIGGIYPVATGGDGTTSLTVRLLISQTQR